MPISIDFKNRLCELVDETDLTRAELKSLMKISSSSFNNAINYGILPTPRTLIKIADYFKVSLDYLLGNSQSDDFEPGKNPVSFHERFDRLCEEKSVTHYKVGTDCGFDKSLISRWMSKGYLPSLEILELIADYFNVSLDYLTGRTDYRN